MCYLHEFVAHWGQESILIFCNPVFHIDLKSTAVHFDVICAAEWNLWDWPLCLLTALSKRTHKVQNAEVGVSKSGWSTRVKGCCLISNIMLSCRPNGIFCNMHNATWEQFLPGLRCTKGIWGLVEVKNYSHSVFCFIGGCIFWLGFNQLVIKVRSFNLLFLFKWKHTSYTNCAFCVI